MSDETAPDDARQPKSSRSIRINEDVAATVIGLEFRVARLREAGWKPIAIFGGAAVFNLAIALLVASILFQNFQVWTMFIANGVIRHDSGRECRPTTWRTGGVWPPSRRLTSQ